MLSSSEGDAINILDGIICEPVNYIQGYAHVHNTIMAVTGVASHFLIRVRACSTGLVL